MSLEAWRHYLRARLLETFRRHPQALDEYRACLRYDAGFARARNGLAFRLAALGRHDEAETHFAQAVHAQPDNAVLWFNLGFLRDRRHDHPRAAEAFREAVRLNPKLDRAWYGLGLALVAQGSHGEAAQAFEKAALLEPKNGHIWYQLAMTYHAMHQADKVKGIVEYLDRFDRHMARKLILDSGRSDLAHVVADLHKR
jgi:tetratricopeptide (TPR) repeat protein